MTPSIDMEALLQLSIKERAHIAEVLLQSLEREHRPPGASEDDIRERLRDLKERPDQKMLSWAELCEAVGWNE